MIPPGAAIAGAPARDATYARFYRSAPQITDGAGARTWITRGANFVVTVTDAVPGTVLARQANADEYFVLLTPGAGAVIEAGGATVESAGDSLTIVPPGPSSMRVTGKGLVTRLFTSKATDLCAQASNAASYADGAPEVAPIVPWPDPPGGFKLRHYELADHLEPKSFGRLFRTTSLMINVFEPTSTPRDVKKLSPHSHDDFEQGSLALSGTFLHHLRTPWIPDMTGWRDDEHAEFASPSLLVIPAKLIHTTQYVGPEPSRFVDIFAPPRLDFSKKEGWVRNAAEYPMPK